STQKEQPNPNSINSRTRRQRAIEITAVPIAEPIESTSDETAEAGFDMFRAQQIRRHHRRQDKSYNARNENGARERERKFSEKRAGQSALQRDWCVNRGERDRHGDDRTDQFA